MSEELVKIDDPLLYIEYVATLDDLNKVFPKLPPPEKVKDGELRLPVQCTMRSELQASSTLLLIPNKTATVAYLKFKKFNDNNKVIWIYEGKVKL